jgi:hypothetical protein
MTVDMCGGHLQVDVLWSAVQKICKVYKPVSSKGFNRDRCLGDSDDFVRCRLFELNDKFSAISDISISLNKNLFEVS